MTDVMVSLRLPGALYRAVLEAANASDMSVSEWIRQAIEDQLKGARK